MEKEIFDLYLLQSRLKTGIEGLFPSMVWVKAEISAIKCRPEGHCWLELSQSGASGLVAKASAVIWSSKYRFLSPYFESVTGSPLREGMLVLVKVQVNFSELYGLSLIINDIDPEYTLGDKERIRLETIGRLKSEGLMDLQKELPLSALPEKLAVVSAPDAAGYRDFMRHLHENPFGFSFDTVLFEALMQGAEAPASIIAALDAVMSDGRDFDAVLILRGGGAKLDLACYDDYGLASAIARCPLPVFTAVGHDQDYHVCDMVSYASLKTPTAMADEILEIYKAEDQRLLSYGTRVRQAVSDRLHGMESRVGVLAAGIRGAFLNRLTAMSGFLDLIGARISASDPRNILKKGYALAVDADGVPMKGAAGKRPGDRLSLMFSDGTLDCRVEEIKA